MFASYVDTMLVLIFGSTCGISWSTDLLRELIENVGSVELRSLELGICMYWKFITVTEGTETMYGTGASS